MHEANRELLDSAPHAVVAAIAVAPIRLLAVATAAADRLMIAKGLSGAGIVVEIDHEPLGEPVFERLCAAEYDCVVVDCELPDVDGRDLVERIRQSQRLLPIIALTAEGEQKALMQAGATAYLAKDRLSPSRLARRIRSAVIIWRAEALAHAALVRAEDLAQLLTAIVEQIPVGVVVVLPEGRVLSANRAAKRTGLDYMEPSGPLQKVLAEGGSAEQELAVVDEDASERLLQVTATAVRGRDGHQVAAVLVLHDLTVERVALDQAESAVRARENVLAVVSHDLRSPLNAISIAAEELAEGELDDDERRLYAGAIGRGLHRCGRLIDDLLDAGKIQGGGMQVTPRPTNARDLLKRVAADHTAAAADIGITLTVEAPPDLGTVMLDPDRLQQALANLIGNALQHTPRNGTIVLGGKASAGRVTFTVTDSGPGIPAENLPRVFELYWQSTRTRRGSAGLGLAIVHGIVAAHGGRVAVESPVGAGATFSIVLPAD